MGGHHPGEIKAVLETLEEFYPERELIFVFQPHRYTRTFYLWKDFVEVLKPYKGIITPIYPASEEPIPNITSERLAKESNSLYAEESEVAKLLKELLKGENPKVVVFLGAGSIGRWCKEIVNRLKD